MVTDNRENGTEAAEDGPTAEALLWEPPESSKADRRAITERVVFGTAAALAITFVSWGAIWTGALRRLSEQALDALVHAGGWVFVLLASLFVVFALWLAVSRYGAITLGREDEEPEFRTVSWFAMMFAAGMGIGLMFFGAYEPLEHFRNSPPGMEAAGEGEAIQQAMANSLFHWTLHPWAIYALVGLAIAYGTFRRGRGQLISAAFIPLIGERRASGALGRVIDVLALFATLFGTAASLGLGTYQIAGGFQELGWIESIGLGVLLLVIATLISAFVLSAVSGVAKGIQWLSNINMVVAFLLVLFLLVMGSTVFTLNLIPTALGGYFGDFFTMAARTDAVGGADTAEWLSTWTIFYWAWWLSWSPFVGMFLARISRGRTIREFIAGVILVPSTVSLLWFSVLGGSTLEREIATGGAISAAGDAESQLYALLEQFPLAGLLSVLVMVLISIFFITGADSASIIMGTMSQRGSIEPNRLITVFWGLMIGGVAAVMMIVGGDEALAGLQNLTILAAAPFAVVIMLLCVSLMRDLRSDPMVVRAKKARELVYQAVVSGAEEYGSDFHIEVSAGDEEQNGEEGGGEDRSAAGAYEPERRPPGSRGPGRPEETKPRD